MRLRLPTLRTNQAAIPRSLESRRVVRRQGGQRPVHHGPEPLVGQAVPLAAAGQRLDGIRTQPVRLDESGGRIARREARQQRAFLPPDDQLADLVRPDGPGCSHLRPIESHR